MNLKAKLPEERERERERVVCIIHSSMARLRLVLFVAVVVSAALTPPSAVAQLRTDYYASTCPNLETIVRGSVRQSMAQSKIAAPAALRLFFHDCAVMVTHMLLIPASCWLPASSACSRSIELDRPGVDATVRISY